VQRGETYTYGGDPAGREKTELTICEVEQVEPAELVLGSSHPALPRSLCGETDFYMGVRMGAPSLLMWPIKALCGEEDDGHEGMQMIVLHSRLLAAHACYVQPGTLVAL
jgi:hypothetical protein